MSTTSLSFDPQVYSTPALLKACYRFSDRFVFDVKSEASKIEVHVESRRHDISPEALHLAMQDFRTEVLDQNLREKVRAETESVRNLILAHAFSRTGLVNQ